MRTTFLHSRRLGWVVLFAGSTLFSSYFLRCDRAALNFQRGLFQGLGENVSDQIAGAVD